jgi:hypothetical protein
MNEWMRNSGKAVNLRNSQQDSLNPLLISRFWLRLVDVMDGPHTNNELAAEWCTSPREVANLQSFAKIR